MGQFCPWSRLRSTTRRFGQLHGSGLVITDRTMQGHLVPHLPQTKIQGPLHRVLFKRFASGLDGSEALADEPRGCELLPLQNFKKCQSWPPLPLFREIAEAFWAVDPEHSSFFIDEVATLSLLDPHHGINTHSVVLVAVVTRSRQPCCYGNLVSAPSAGTTAHQPYGVIVAIGLDAPTIP